MRALDRARRGSYPAEHETQAIPKSGTPEGVICALAGAKRSVTFASLAPRTHNHPYRTSACRLCSHSDTFRRDVNVLGADGYVPVSLRSSNQARLASQHLIAVGRSLRTGDTESLKPFVGKRVGGVELLTDPDRLDVFADAGLVKLDALYRGQRGGTEKSV